MRTKLTHGAILDFLTPGEAKTMLAEMVPERDRPQRVRLAASIVLDANGNGQDEVYTVPIGYEFAARRVFLNLSSASGPVTGAVALNVAGKFIAFLRSGTLIEYAIPLAPTAIAQVPGVQTWSNEEGPYLRNGETFEVQALGLTAGAGLTVTLEGILARPPR